MVDVGRGYSGFARSRQRLSWIHEVEAADGKGLCGEGRGCSSRVCEVQPEDSKGVRGRGRTLLGSTSWMQRMERLYTVEAQDVKR